MRFYVSHNTISSTICLFITNQQFENHVEELDSIRQCFGPWMFLGVKQLEQEQFINLYKQYLPSAVEQAINTPTTSFNYFSSFVLG